MDYEKLGFKCGLEAHQQLDGLKLFCNCQTLNLRNTEPDIIFERKLRAVAGETGEVDKAAKHEMAKSKRYIYVGDSKDCCLLEMDEEPPHSINKDALKVALQVSLLFNAKIVDEIEVMRKTVVDGSNTSGFQRTALVAYDGILETSKGDVRIESILLEEEACQQLEKTKEYTKYRLDRLGIPLIEIGTGPDIKDNEHAKEVAEKIGMILRSTGGCKRGIGTIRQDVNVSIKGRNRVEIKGFQEIKIMPKVIESEVKRQIALKKAEDGHVRNFNKDGTTNFLRPMPGSDRLYPETDVAPIVITKEMSSAIEVPELIADKLDKLEKKYSISKDKIKSLGNDLGLFEEIVDKNKKIKSAFVCETLLSYKSEIKNKKGDVEKVQKEHIVQVFGALNDGKILKNNVMDILVDVSLGKKLDISKYKVEEIDLESEIKKIVSSKPGLNPGGYMGLIMAKFKGKVDGKKAMEILKRILN